MTALELLEEIEAVGGTLTLRGDRVAYELPQAAHSLVAKLRGMRDEVVKLLVHRSTSLSTVCPVHGHENVWERPTGGFVCGICHPSPYKLDRTEGDLPTMPAGVRLVQWQLRQPPVLITRQTIVNDIDKFARATLLQLQAAVEGRKWAAGHWPIRELIERLEQVGVTVTIEDKSPSLGQGDPDERGKPNIGPT